MCLVANNGRPSVFEDIVGVRPSPWPHSLLCIGATVSGYALPILLKREAVKHNPCFGIGQGA